MQLGLVNVKGLRALRASASYLGQHPVFRAAPFVTLLRLASWRLRSLAGGTVSVALETWKVTLLVPGRWRGTGKLIYVFRDQCDPDLKILSLFLKPGAVFIDVGAHLGIYSAIAGRLVGERGSVFAFEPGEEIFGLLEKNIKLNRLTNVKTFRTALADRTGSISLYHHPDPSRDSLGRPSDHDVSVALAEDVPVARLDDVLRQSDAERIDLVKIDVEGAEELVLRGAEALITQTRPKVLFEINPAAAASLGLAADGAWRLLENWGYCFHRLTAEQLRPLQSPPDGVQNVLAIQSEDKRAR